MSRFLAATLALTAVLVLSVPASAGPAGGFKPSQDLGDILTFIKPNIRMEAMSVFEHGDVISVPYVAVKLKNTGLKSTGSFRLYDWVTIDGAMAYPWPHHITVSSLAPGASRWVYLVLPYQQIGKLQTYAVTMMANYDHAVSESTYADNNMSGIFVR